MKKWSYFEVGFVSVLLALVGVMAFQVVPVLAAGEGLRSNQDIVVIRNGVIEGLAKYPKTLGGPPQPGDIEMFSIWVGTNGPTNLDLKAYFAKTTNSGGVLQLRVTGGVLSSNYFTTNTPGITFQGSQTVSVTNGWNVIPFQTDTNAFSDLGDRVIVIFPYAVGSNTPYPMAGAAVYPIDGPAD